MGIKEGVGLLPRLCCVLFIHSLMHSINIKHFLCDMYWVRGCSLCGSGALPHTGAHVITTRHVGRRGPETYAIFVIYI